MNTQIAAIAETLRGMINTDNDAKRLIAEAVLPLMGLPSSVEYIREMIDLQIDAETLVSSVEIIIEEMEEMADEDGDPELAKFAARLREQIESL